MFMANVFSKFNVVFPISSSNVEHNPIMVFPTYIAGTVGCHMPKNEPQTLLYTINNGS